MRLSRRQRIGLLCAVAVAITSLRLIHLAADTPRSLWTEGRGEFLDEGTKTLSARNLVLFGQTHWNPQDDYPGWMKVSPVTQALFYVSFLVFEATIEAAKLVTIAWFLFFLLAYAVSFANSYPTSLGVLGVLLLGLIHPLFLYSRTALFEVPLIACLFGSLLLLKGDRASLRGRTLVLLTAVCLFATLGIKRSALLYFLPVLLVLTVSWIRDVRAATMRSKALAPVAALLAVSGLVISTREIWSSRIFLSPRNIMVGVLANPLTDSLPVVVLLGLVSATFLLLAWQPAVRQRPYVLALLSLALLGPALISLFAARPLRYYIPLIPAYPLLLVECLHQRPWKEWSEKSVSNVARALGPVLLVLSAATLLQFLNRFVLSLFPLEPVVRPGFQGPIQLRYLIPASVVIGIGAWLGKARFFRQRNPVRLLAALTGLALLISGVQNARFLRSATFDRRDLSVAIARLVPPEKSIIGELAPLLALGTDVPSLAMLAHFNRAPRIPTLRPDYLLYSEPWPGVDDAREFVQTTPGVELREPILEGSLHGLSVILYPLAYHEVGWDPPPAGVNR